MKQRPNQCEAHDLVPTEDDAIDVRCERDGIPIIETDDLGRKRRRVVCIVHRCSWTPN